MNRQKITNRVSAAVSMCLLSSSLVVGPSAHAVTPDNRDILGGIWTTANLAKEYFDWRGWAGWGAVGLTNTIITVARGDSQGAFTKAMFSNLCGSAAAGFVSTWKPIAAPTVASHMTAIVKAGTTVAAASTCGWAAQFATEFIDAETRKAQNAINSANARNQPNYREIVTDVAKANQQLTNMEKDFRDIAANMDIVDKNVKNLRDSRCSASPSQACNLFEAKRVESLKRAQTILDAHNAAGRELAKQLKELAFDVKT